MFAVQRGDKLRAAAPRHEDGFRVVRNDVKILASRAEALVQNQRLQRFILTNSRNNLSVFPEQFCQITRLSQAVLSNFDGEFLLLFDVPRFLIEIVLDHFRRIQLVVVD